MKFFKKREENHLASVIFMQGGKVVIFENGEFETKDEGLCSALVEMGYRNDGEVKIVEPVEEKKKKGRKKADSKPVGEDSEETGSQVSDEGKDEEKGEESLSVDAGKNDIAAFAFKHYGVAISTDLSKDEMLVMLQAVKEEKGKE